MHVSRIEFFTEKLNMLVKIIIVSISMGDRFFCNIIRNNYINLWNLKEIKMKLQFLPFITKSTLALGLTFQATYAMESPSSAIEETKKQIHLERALPIAKDLESGFMVFSDKQFAEMDKYFAKANALPKAVIPYDLDNSVFGFSIFENNDVAMVSMNDSCLVLPNSGVNMISLDNLIDCVGLFLFHPKVGSAGAHVTIGTTLKSLDKLINPFQGQEGVKVTLLTSWKTTLFSKIVRHIGTNKKLSDISIFTNNIIQQMSSDGNRLKRFVNPGDFPELREKFIQIMENSAPKEKTWALIEQFIDKIISAPMGAVLNTSTGKVSFINVEGKANLPHVSSGAIFQLRKLRLSLPCWDKIRYLADVKPNEDKRNVDIAFFQYQRQ